MSMNWGARFVLAKTVHGITKPYWSLQWRHNGHDSVSNHQSHDYLLNGLFRRRSKKHQSSASLAFVRGIHRGPVNSPHKWPVTRKMFPFDDVIMQAPSHIHIYPLVEENLWVLTSKLPPGDDTSIRFVWTLFWWQVASRVWVMILNSFLFRSSTLWHCIESIMM